MDDTLVTAEADLSEAERRIELAAAELDHPDTEFVRDLLAARDLLRRTRRRLARRVGQAA